jgi:hypothetical protein
MTEPDELAYRLAHARRRLAMNVGARPWHEQHKSAVEDTHYLTALEAGQVQSAQVTATLRDTVGRLIDRDTYASQLQARAERSGRRAARYRDGTTHCGLDVGEDLPYFWP